jgi:hypothetical protein
MMGVSRKFHSATDKQLQQLQKLLVPFSKLAKLIHNGMLLAIFIKISFLSDLFQVKSVQYWPKQSGNWQRPITFMKLFSGCCAQ